ncbi:MAG: hypothetical protein ABW217_09195 [Polyangiaceae bacterium]
MKRRRAGASCALHVPGLRGCVAAGADELCAGFTASSLFGVRAAPSWDPQSINTAGKLASRGDLTYTVLIECAGMAFSVPARASGAGGRKVRHGRAGAVE